MAQRTQHFILAADPVLRTMQHRLAAKCDAPASASMNGAPNLTKDKLLKFLDRLGASAKTAGTCFITGGN